MRGKRLLTMAMAVSLLASTGCEYAQTHETGTGALVGAGSGALLGGIIGNQSHNAGAGALIGGAAGALLGGGIGYAMQRQREEFEQKLQNVQVQQVPAETPQGQAQVIVLTMGDQVLFEFGKAELRPSAQATLNQIADILKDPQGQMPSRIVVTGHTDNVGDYNFNKQLSQDRADRVKAYLISEGINPGILYTQGMGPDQPVASNETDAGRAQNRRVELKIFP